MNPDQTAMHEKKRDFSDHREVIAHLLELPNYKLNNAGLNRLAENRKIAQQYVEGFTVQMLDQDGYWEDMDESPYFRRTKDSYRIKPQTQTINGVEVPLPLQEELKEGESYFVEAIEEKPLSVSCIWESDSEDYLFIERGIAHKERRNAVACAKARLGIDPYAEGK